MCRHKTTMRFRVYRISRNTTGANYSKMALHVLAAFYRGWKGWSCSDPLFVLPTAWSLNVSLELGTTLLQLLAINCPNTEPVALHPPLATANTNAYLLHTSLSGRSAC
jgi:hypothetical protein